MGLIDSLKKAFSKPCKTISVAQAKELLASQGYKDYSLRGGMGAWRAAGDPSVSNKPIISKEKDHG